MQTINVKLKSSGVKLPVYSTNGSGAFDIFADVSDHDSATYGVYPGMPTVFNTGLFFEIPEDKVLLIFSRSGQGFNDDVRLANCVGIIDSDYRGEVKVKLTQDVNALRDAFGVDGYTVKAGSRIAQGLIIDAPRVLFNVVDELSETDRGTSGFGSTGK